MSNGQLEIIDEYYEDGIRIKVLKGFTEIKPRIYIPQDTKVKRNLKHAQGFYNQKLRDWCNEGSKRLVALSENSGYSLSWFEQRRYGIRILTEKDYRCVVLPAIHQVEDAEKLKRMVYKYT